MTISILEANNLKIFSLIISQKEGEIASAKLEVLRGDAFSDAPLNGTFVYQNNDQTEVIFKGKRVGFPRQIDSNLAQVEYTSEPDDAPMQLHNLAQSLKTPPFYDDLFVEVGDENPVNVLEARSDLFVWDRRTGTASLTSLFQGDRVLDLSDSILEGSLKLSLGDTPLDSITIEVSAEWIQQADGDINIFPKIAKKFPKGLVNTLTTEQLTKQWPKVGDKIGPEASLKQSGYQVVKSTLRPITPPNTGILGIYPTVTPEITTLVDGKPCAVRLKRSWFKGDLWLYWHYFQKRREVLRFTLNQSSKLSGRIRPRQKRLTIQLQSVQNHLVNRAASSFFISPRGRLAVIHALEIAKAHLAGSSRCVEVEFEVPLSHASDISLRDSVRLKSDKIPGDLIVGKVIGYTFSITPESALARIKLGIAAGSPVDFKAPEPKTEDIYCNDEQESYFKTPSGIAFKAYDNQTPTQGILHPLGLTIHDFIKGVQVQGTPEKQFQHLLENEYPNRDDTLGALADVPTIIDVQLLDLRTQPVLEHTIDLDILNTWSSPDQINL